jgi:hypothetical protein
MIQTFKGALHEVVFNSKIPAKQLCDAVGKSPTYLYNASNESQEDSHLRGRDIIALTNATGNYALLEHLNAACDHIAIHIPKFDAVNASSFIDVALSTMERLGEYTRKYREAMEDSIISVDELRELEALEYEFTKYALSLRGKITK